VFADAQAQFLSEKIKDSSVQNDGYFRHQVKGTVLDGGGQPILGATVSYLNLSSVVTDSMGEFVLKVPNHYATIRVKVEGYDPKNIPLRGKKSLQVIMKEETRFSFYSNVQLPYSEGIKSNTTFSVTKVKNRDKWSTPFESPGAFLQGRVSGMNVIRRSGIPGVGADIFLR